MSEEVRSGISKRCGMYGLCGEESRDGAVLFLSFLPMAKERLSEGKKSWKGSEKRIKWGHSTRGK